MPSARSSRSASLAGSSGGLAEVQEIPGVYVLGCLQRCFGDGTALELGQIAAFGPQLIPHPEKTNPAEAGFVFAPDKPDQVDISVRMFFSQLSA